MAIENAKLEKKRISILGCGWLGFQLAKRLLALDITSEIKGSTTSAGKLEQFEKAGIKGYQLSLNPDLAADESVIQSFFDTDALVISLPPGLSKNESGFYVRQIESVIEAIKKSPVQEVILISSTSIYPDLNRVVTEADVVLPETSASPEMVVAENLLISLRPQRSVSVLRHGGLIGYNRIPGKYVKGKRNMTTGDLRVNYIHPDDASEMMAYVLKSGVLNETFNIVAPLHPTRREVYESNCAQFGWEAPTFTEPGTRPDFKIISGDKFSAFYKYKFKHPDPLLFPYALTEQED
jgi:nucleoside-diphosphate-sugar epimerase